MKRRVLFGLLVLVVGLLLSLPGNVGRAQESKGAAAPAAEGGIKPGDGLQVLVFGHPELSRTVQVQPDGSITFLPIGRIVVESQTVEGVTSLIVKGLEETYRMREPRVAVAIESFGPRASVYILGGINAAGSYPIPQSHGLTLTQLVALCGGFAPDADLSQITVQHFSRGRRTHQTVDLSDLERAGFSRNDIELKDADTVYVRRRRAPGTVSIGEVSMLGQVNGPRALPVDPTQPMTLLQALAKAGGLTRLADRDDVVILSRSGGAQQRTVVDVNDVIDGDVPDPVLRPGDIVVVGERGW